MSKNFYGATEIEDDYAFEEADDPRTWFPRTIDMDCENGEVEYYDENDDDDNEEDKNNNIISSDSKCKTSSEENDEKLPWWQKGQYA